LAIIIATIIVGLFIVGLAFLQYQHMVSINWGKFEFYIAALASAMTNALNENSIALTSNFGIPLSGSMASGFTVGFLKG
jgi:uncharacterized membrane protein (Fun14 family)